MTNNILVIYNYLWNKIFFIIRLYVSITWWKQISDVKNACKYKQISDVNNTYNMNEFENTSVLKAC